jgi:hypothetical protein
VFILILILHIFQLSHLSLKMQVIRVMRKNLKTNKIKKRRAKKKCKSK